MENIYILDIGAYIKKEGNSLKVIKDGKVTQFIPAENLKRLTLIGHIALSGGVLDFLIKNRIETVFMTPTGRFMARLGIDEHRHVELRRSQYLKLSDNSFSLKTATIIVKGKINNMSRLLAIRARQYEEKKLKEGSIRLRAIIGAMEDVKDMGHLRGIEGNASRIYFEYFPFLIRNTLFDFKGRNKRPPLDPVNALLSFVYTMLTNEVLSAINSCGLDPYLGALHEVSYGRPSLACDLVEEYRTFLGDRLVLSLINQKAISPDDFVYRNNSPSNFIDEEEMKAKRPVEMKPAISKSLIETYEQMMNRPITYRGKRTTYRLIILSQVRSFAKYILGQESLYSTFSWEK